MAAMRVVEGVLIGSPVAIGGCANQSTGTRPGAAPVASNPEPRSAAASGDDGEYVGPKPAANSKFAKLKFGMSRQDVMNTIGAPSNSTTHETGKRWIPFYDGGDARRSELLDDGEGCLTFTAGNRFGSGSSELIKIQTDPRGGCFES